MKIGREKKEGMDLSTESGRNEATTDDATVDIQHTEDGDEHEDEWNEEDSASASEEKKDEVVHRDTRDKKKRPASDGGDKDDGEVDEDTCLENDLTGYIVHPVNFDTNHWACLVVNKLNKEIVVYDSMNKRNIGKILKLMALDIDGGLLESASKHLTMTTPRQKDGDSCGVFVCLRFWRQVSNAASTDVSSGGFGVK
ncbi:hypothetical protein PInf_005854 [Phytophthora infestans]|nr:hypothetical protein PInf_005854 [Phytophthora infestans]